MIGGFLFAAAGKGQMAGSIGFMVRAAYPEMRARRMAAGILCGFAGTLLYCPGVLRTVRFCFCRHNAADRKPRASQCAGRIGIGSLWMMRGLLSASGKVGK